MCACCLDTVGGFMKYLRNIWIISVLKNWLKIGFINFETFSVRVQFIWTFFKKWIYKFGWFSVTVQFIWDGLWTHSARYSARHHWHNVQLNIGLILKMKKSGWISLRVNTPWGICEYQIIDYLFMFSNIYP